MFIATIPSTFLLRKTFMKIITTLEAPEAVGPFAQALVFGNLLFCSGQIAMDPETMKIIGSTIEDQTEQVFRNMGAVLKAAGRSFSHVIKTTVFLQDMDDFMRMNAVYESIFAGHKPARSTVQVARLPFDALIEIECIAASE